MSLWNVEERATVGGKVGQKSLGVLVSLGFCWAQRSIFAPGGPASWQPLDLLLLILFLRDISSRVRCRVLAPISPGDRLIHIAIYSLPI